MNTVNHNRRLALKSIGAFGASGVLVACGGGTSSTPIGIQYFTEPSIPVGSTEITGVRGVTGSRDVFLTGINMDNTTSPDTNYGLLYRGPILIPNASSWYKIGPAVTVLRANAPADTSHGLNFYGPNNGTSAGSVVVAGNYNLSSTGERAYGLLYQGPIDGSGLYTNILPASLVQAPGVVIATIAHSNMNGYVVGNYDTSLDASSHAFIMDMGNTPTDPSTYTYFDIPLSIVTGGAVSITAYGIWYNSNLNNYTIVGGYDKVTGDNGLSTGYLVDWDPVNGFTNFASLFYNNDSTTSKVSHIEGITTDNAGGYYLAVNWAQNVAGYPAGAAFVQVSRTSAGGFGTPVWTNFAFPGAAVTSANTVFEKNVLGIYLDPAPTTPYLAVFP